MTVALTRAALVAGIAAATIVLLAVGLLKLVELM